jgi:hypothetical protein
MGNSNVTIQTVGLYSEPNQLSVPEGALTEASNVIIQRDNVIEPRRGFKLFGTPFGTITDRLKQLFVYKFRLLRHWGNTLEFDTGTLTNSGEELFSPFDASVEEAQAGLRIKSVESNGNFFFTSSQGIRKLSAATTKDFTTAPGYLTLAGGIKALDLTANPILAQGNITGFLPQDGAVAYRAVWGTIDNNKNLILGVPSQRAEVFNSLTNLLSLDFDTVLNAIQNTANQTSPNNSVISDADYVSTLAVTSNATPEQIQTNMIALASKLDTDLLLANSAGTAPLTISAFNIVNNTTPGQANVATITFSSGNPSNYWSSGSIVYLTGFPKGENLTDMNGLESISSVTSTTISFLTTATTNSQIFTGAAVTTGTPGRVTITAHGFNNGDAFKFSNSGGALPTGLTAGTTYFAGNVTANTFDIYSDAGLTTPVNVSAIGTGTNTVTLFFPVTNTSINSGEFRSLTTPGLPSQPATDDQLLALQAYLQQIIGKLQGFPSTGTPPIVSAFSQTNYITGLSVTTSANVKLVVTIPQQVTTKYFVQIYRSSVIQATGTASLSQLTPSDELQLVYEAFPTADELAAGVMTIIDVTPDQFLGADLYTNEASGVGIANANETPPFALDINKYKNYVFLANTRTKYRMSLSLLGVSKLVEDYEDGITPTITISDGTRTNIYSFVIGVQQEVQITTVADVAGSLNSTAFAVFTANDETEYYFWYNVDGTGVDPAIADAVGIQVPINTNDNANTVAAKTNQVISTVTQVDFNSSVAGNVITIQNANEGYTSAPLALTSGFAVSTTLAGQGQKLSRSLTRFGTVADVFGTLAGTYFTAYTSFDQQQYYFWYRVSGTGVDPVVAGMIGFPIDISTNDSSFTVASKTAAQINASLPTVFVASNPSANNLEISPYGFGPSTSSTAGTSGFALNSFAPGFLQVLLSNKVSPAQAVDETARSFVEAINRNPAETIYSFYLSQSSTVPGQMTLESRTLTTPEYYLVANNENTGSSFNPDLSPTNKVASLTSGDSNNNIVVTTDPHGLVTGDQIFMTGTASVPNIDGVRTILYLTPTSFRIDTTIGSATTTNAYVTPVIDANGGDNEARPNRIYYSAFQQPEAFPLPNTIDVGDADKAILRIFPLRDSLFVFKEDGLFRISGEQSPFTLQLFDPSCVLIAPDSVSVSKNVIYGWTTQGILNVTEAGVSNPPVSRPIDVSILPLTKENYSSFPTATWGIGYESDNSYIVFTVKEPTDTGATIAYRYSTLTSSWTTFDKTDTCGIVNIADDKLYLGAGDANSIEQERKTFSRLDYADKELVLALNDGKYFGNSINLTNVNGVSAGDVLIQNQTLTVYEFNILLQKLTNDPGLQNNQISSITTGLTPIITTVGNHFLSTGDYVNITQTQTTPNIDGLYQVNVLSATTFQVTVPKPILTGGTTGLVKYDYYENLKVSGGTNLQNNLIALATRLNIEPNLIYREQTGTIVTNTAASPTIVELTAPHNLGIAGTVRQIRISGNTGSVPSINGDFEVTVVDDTHLSIDLTVTVPGTGGSFDTIDDYLTAISSTSGAITNIKASNPTVITAPNHGMVSDRFIRITSANSSPVIDGNYQATIIDENNFTIPINVLIQGTSGFFSTIDGNFVDLQTNYNYIVNTLNVDSGTAFKNYIPISSTTSQETIITAVNTFTNTLSLNLTLDLVVGPVTVFKAIPTAFTYSPITFKDALNLKQISEATLMFENKQFSTGTLSFKSDLVPDFIPVTVPGNGNGNFGGGTGKFGGNFFGGGANAAPFRTYIPRPTQRCRYIVPQFTHTIALEKYSINGLSLTGNVQESSRAYR